MLFVIILPAFMMVVMHCGADVLLSCCQYLNNPESLMECLRADTFGSPPRLDVIYATFISPEVYSYAGNNMLYNSRYFDTNGFGLKILSKDTGDDYYPLDRRWNKVKAVANALGGWARSYSYVVFIDADLAIINREFNVDRVISDHSNANLILAEDQIDIANTGFLIVKNTPWSIAFFEKWWDAKEMKGTFCDQHVLNKLLEDPYDRSLVAITGPKTINSKWPAIDNFRENDSILHLMGETHAVRNAVSVILAQSICTRALGYVSEVSPSVAASSVGVHLTKAELLRIKHQTVMTAWEISKTRCVSSAATESDFDALHESVGQRCDPTKRRVLDEKHIHAECEQMLREALAIHAAKSASLAGASGGDSGMERRRNDQRVMHINHMSMLQYDLLELTIDRVTGDPAKKHAVYDAAQRVLTVLDALEEALDMRMAHNVAYVHHKRAMVFGLLGQHHLNHRQFQQAMEREMTSISELSAALQVVSETQSEFSSFVMSYVHSAARLAEAFRGQNRLAEAEEWALNALTNAQLLYEANAREERLRVMELVNIHALCREIYKDLHDRDKFNHHAHEINVLSGF